MARAIDPGGLDGVVSGPAVSARSSVFRRAGPTDDARLRRLLRETPVGAWVRLSYEREPDFFAATALEGEAHHTFVADDPSGGGFNAVFSHSVRQRFVGGVPRRVGYLGQLRVRDGYAGKGRLIRDGFALCRHALETPDIEPYFLTTIIADNHRASRILTAGLKGMPTYTPLGTLGVLACRSRAARARPVREVTVANEDDLPAIAAFLRAQGVRYDFTPVWSAEDLCSPPICPQLAVKDVLVVRGRDGIVGCATVWDQRAIKQTVVRGYRPLIVRLRPLFNLLSPVTGLPRLPGTGECLNTAFLSHFHVGEGHDDVAVPLMEAALALAHERGLAALVTGLDVRDPRYRLLTRRFRPTIYRSDVYAAHWSRGDEAVKPLGRRLLAPEIAVL